MSLISFNKFLEHVSLFRPGGGISYEIPWLIIQLQMENPKHLHTTFKRTERIEKNWAQLKFYATMIVIFQFPAN